VLLLEGEPEGRLEQTVSVHHLQRHLLDRRHEPRCRVAPATSLQPCESCACAVARVRCCVRVPEQSSSAALENGEADSVEDVAALRQITIVYAQHGLT
jgi:hypothetical protein